MKFIKSKVYLQRQFRCAVVPIGTILACALGELRLKFVFYSNCPQRN